MRLCTDTAADAARTLLALHSAVNMISDSPKSMLVFYLLGSYFAGDKVQSAICRLTSIKYKVERDERYLPYIELGRWLCSHFQLETPLNFHKPITQKLYNIEKQILHYWIIYVYLKPKKTGGNMNKSF